MFVLLCTTSSAVFRHIFISSTIFLTQSTVIISNVCLLTLQALCVSIHTYLNRLCCDLVICDENLPDNNLIQSRSSRSIHPSQLTILNRCLFCIGKVSMLGSDMKLQHEWFAHIKWRVNEKLSFEMKMQCTCAYFKKKFFRSTPNV